MSTTGECLHFGQYINWFVKYVLQQKLKCTAVHAISSCRYKRCQTSFASDIITKISMPMKFVPCFIGNNTIEVTIT